MTKQTVGKCAVEFMDRRLDGLFDEPRPGVPHKITDADVERVLTTNRAGDRQSPPSQDPWA